MTLLLVYVLVALGFSFLCSVAEAVVLSVTPSYIASLEQKRAASARLLRDLKRNIDRPLAAILSLNTIAHTVGAVGAGAQAAAVFGSNHVGVASAVLTFLILVLSEIIPKTLGARYWRRLAPPVAVGLRGLIWILYPLVFLSEQLTRLLSPGHTVSLFSREEFTALAKLGVEEGQVDSSESHILENLFRFRSVKVADIMTPREVVLTFPASLSVGDVFSEHGRLPFSRIPVYGDGEDDITGFVLKDELVLAHARGEDRRMIGEFRRDLFRTPEDSSLLHLFQRLMRWRAHISIVVDGTRKMTGIVTLEDVIETILGLEIVDETDPAVDMRELARRWRSGRGGRGTEPGLR